MAKDKLIFYKEWWRGIQDLPAWLRYEFIDIVMDIVFDDDYESLADDDLSPEVKRLVNMILPQIKGE